MKQQHSSIIVAAIIIALLIADQALKIWVKTHMYIGQEIEIFSWFKLLFIENNGAAFGKEIEEIFLWFKHLFIENNGADFGMQIPSNGFDWSKLLLSILRVLMVAGLCYYTYTLVRKKAPMGVLVGLALIIAGALGNILDSAFYGIMFSASPDKTQVVAEFGGSYAPFMMGKVVDMFYLPLFQWKNHPQWLSFLFDSRGYFFGPVFNLADAYISVAVVYLLAFQYKTFK